MSHYLTEDSESPFCTRTKIIGVQLAGRTLYDYETVEINELTYSVETPTTTDEPILLVHVSLDYGHRVEEVGLDELETMFQKGIASVSKDGE